MFSLKKFNFLKSNSRRRELHNAYSQSLIVIKFIYLYFYSKKLYFMNRKAQTSLKSDIDKLIHLYRSKNFNSALKLSNSLLELNPDEPFLLNINGIISI